MALLSILANKVGLGTAEKGVQFKATNMKSFDVVDEDRTRTVTLSVLKVDATIQETHVSSVDISEHPIEDGSNVDDHITIKPKEITINGIVTDTPFTSAAQIGGLITSGAVALGSKLGSVGGLVGAGVGATIGGMIGLSQNRAKDGFAFLQELQDQKQIFDVVTGLKLYKNMVLVNLSIPRTNQTGKAINFTATMKSINVVAAEVINIPEAAIKSDVSASATAKQNLGRSTKKALSETKDATTKSWAAAAWDKVF
jgi:hypothetical protein